MWASGKSRRYILYDDKTSEMREGGDKEINNGKEKEEVTKMWGDKWSKKRMND